MSPKYFALALFAMLCIVGLGSCVDIPGGPPESALDFHAQVRFVHMAVGVDTVFFFASRDRDTARTSTNVATTIYSGSDTILAHDTTTILQYPKVYYRRFRVDFSSPLEVMRDGSSDGVLALGSNTPYRQIPSGDRRVSLLADAQLVDTLVVQHTDTVLAQHRDTVGTGRGSSKNVTVSSSVMYWNNVPSSATMERIVADFKDPKLVISTDRKVTVFLLHDTRTINSLENGLLRYGVINYLVGTERYTFASPPSSDSIGVRFMNGSQNSGSKKFTMRGSFLKHLTNPDRDTTILVSSTKDSLAFPVYTLNASPDGYLHLHSGVYNVYAYAAGSLIAVDSLVGQSLNGSHRFTFAAVDSAATFRLKRYDDD